MEGLPRIAQKAAKDSALNQPLLPIKQKGEKLLKSNKLEEVIILGHGLTLHEYWHLLRTDPGLLEKRAEGRAEVWGMNFTPFVQDIDMVWNMHDLQRLYEIEPHWPYLYMYRYWLKSHVPLVSVKCYPGIIENSPVYRFPIETVVDELQETYFANGVSYLVAWAMMCGVKKLWMFGVDYDYPDRTEYEAGRTNLEYWLGFAKGRTGMETIVSSNSSLKDTCWRWGKVRKGRIGFGQTYGYFDQSPSLTTESQLVQVKDFPNAQSSLLANLTATVTEQETDGSKSG